MFRYNSLSKSYRVHRSNHDGSLPEEERRPWIKVSVGAEPDLRPTPPSTPSILRSSASSSQKGSIQSESESRSHDLILRGAVTLEYPSGSSIPVESLYSGPLTIKNASAAKNKSHTHRLLKQYATTSRRSSSSSTSTPHRYLVGPKNTSSDTTFRISIPQTELVQAVRRAFRATSDFECKKDKNCTVKPPRTSSARALHAPLGVEDEGILNNFRSVPPEAISTGFVCENGTAPPKTLEIVEGNNVPSPSGVETIFVLPSAIASLTPSEKSSLRVTSKSKQFMAQDEKENTPLCSTTRVLEAESNGNSHSALRAGEIENNLQKSSLLNAREIDETTTLAPVLPMHVMKNDENENPPQSSPSSSKLHELFRHSFAQDSEDEASSTTVSFMEVQKESQSPLTTTKAEAVHSQASEPKSSSHSPAKLSQAAKREPSTMQTVPEKKLDREFGVMRRKRKLLNAYPPSPAPTVVPEIAQVADLTTAAKPQAAGKTCLLTAPRQPTQEPQFLYKEKDGPGTTEKTKGTVPVSAAATRAEVVKREMMRKQRHARMMDNMTVKSQIIENEINQKMLEELSQSQTTEGPTHASPSGVRHSGKRMSKGPKSRSKRHKSPAQPPLQSSKHAPNTQAPKPTVPSISSRISAPTEESKTETKETRRVRELTKWPSPKLTTALCATVPDTRPSAVTENKGATLHRARNQLDRTVSDATAPIIIDAQNGAVNYDLTVPLSPPEVNPSIQSILRQTTLKEEFEKSPQILLKYLKSSTKSRRTKKQNPVVENFLKKIFLKEMKQREESEREHQKKQVRFQLSVKTVNTTNNNKNFVKENTLRMGRLEVVPKPEKLVVDRFGNTRVPGISYTHKPNYGKVPTYIGSFKKQRQLIEKSKASPVNSKETKLYFNFP